jgi:hypothetical protein
MVEAIPMATSYKETKDEDGHDWMGGVARREYRVVAEKRQGNWLMRLTDHERCKSGA